MESVNQALKYLLSTAILDVFLLLIFIFSQILNKDKVFKTPKLSFVGLTLICAIATFFSLYPIQAISQVWFTEIGFNPTPFPYELTPATFAISLISFVLLPAVCEELLFRGLIQRKLSKYGQAFAIFLTSIFFSLFHFSIHQTVYPFLFALLLGVIMSMSDNIIYCITLHACNNLLALTLNYFNVSLYSSSLIYKIFGIILAIAYLIIVISVIIKQNKKSEKKKFTPRVIIGTILAFLILSGIWIYINFFM